MEQIIKSLYLGSDEDVPEAKRRGYSRLSCCKDGPDSHRSMLGYTSLGAPKGKDYLVARRGDWMALNLIDSPDPNMIPDAVIEAGIKFIDEQIKKGKTVFVHCNAGHSRSPSIVMMYLRSVGELPDSFVRAEHIFRTLYRKYDPGVGMLTHARMKWKALKQNG